LHLSMREVIMVVRPTTLVKFFYTRYYDFREKMVLSMCGHLLVKFQY